ncbi:unnamed protein product [Pieris brassicae]|uniref:Uncharacterized protein n=1 Tax=Pieris brassicae TaxID=7116 RepID=A0A9P0TLH8_PIEBR|nr:unnamed protein product [Pieris brassicae]
MFVDILIAFPLRRNPTQPTPVEHKHLMISWRKLSEKRTAQCIAVPLCLVRNYAGCMGYLALVRSAGGAYLKVERFEGAAYLRLVAEYGAIFFVRTCIESGLVTEHRSLASRLPLIFLWVFFGGKPVP